MSNKTILPLPASSSVDIDEVSRFAQYARATLDLIQMHLENKNADRPSDEILALAVASARAHIDSILSAGPKR